MNSDPEDEVGKKLVSLNLEGCCMTIHSGVFSCSPADVSLGSGEVHGGRGLREGGTSGAVCQERRHCPANQRRRGGTVVSISTVYHNGKR